MLHGARDGFSIKTLSRGTNSYPLKGTVAENRTCAHPPTILPLLAYRRQGDGRTRTKDTTSTREEGRGIADYRLRDYNGLERFEANDFPRAEGRSKGEAAGKGRRKRNRGRAGDGG